MSTEDRFDRNERMFGKEGQARLRGTTVALFGAGGLGSHVGQQLALLGVGGINPVDDEELSLSNKNRYVGAWHEDPVPGSLKVELAKRLIHKIDPSIAVIPVAEPFPSSKSLAVLKAADVVFGCVDEDGIRFVLNEACLAYQKPLIDLASDVPKEGGFGGHIVVVTGDNGCLHCRGLLNADDVRRFMSPQESLENEDAVYGVHRRVLDEAGPSVVSLNGTVASLGVTEFMALVTGIRLPYAHLNYYGHTAQLTKPKDDPARDCFYCNVVKGQGDAAGINRYFSLSSVGQRQG